MLEKLSIAMAKSGGGLEMEEKLKDIYGGGDFPSCSFLWSSDPDLQLYKQKVAQYTNSPPPTPPAAQNYRRQVDPPEFQTTFLEQIALRTELIVFRVQIPQGMMCKEFDIIKFTALFVMRYGIHFWNALWDRVYTRAEFKFLDKSIRFDVKCLFFSRLIQGYEHLITRLEYPPGGVGAVLEVFFPAIKKKQEDEGEDQVVDKVETNRRDFVVYDEYFADIENKELLTTPPLMMQFSGPSPPIHVFRVGIPHSQGGMMRKEFGIIMFTAQFVVRYGNEFWNALWDIVSTKTEFQFLKRNPGNDTLFSQLLLAYGNVIQPWGILPIKLNDSARVKAVLEGVFTAFDAFKGKHQEEGDEVVDKVVTDRHDFVVSDEYFQSFLDIEERTPLPERLQMLHEEPEPKRGKLDESALVSEEEFLAQHQGPSTITIHVSAGELPIEIKVQSLSENLASLKEKIAVLMRIPANQLKLKGRTGVLKDDRSLAYYNLGVEEMLTLDF